MYQGCLGLLIGWHKANLDWLTLTTFRRSSIAFETFSSIFFSSFLPLTSSQMKFSNHTNDVFFVSFLQLLHQRLERFVFATFLHEARLEVRKALCLVEVVNVWWAYQVSGYFFLFASPLQIYFNVNIELKCHSPYQCLLLLISTFIRSTKSPIAYRLSPHNTIILFFSLVYLPINFTHSCTIPTPELIKL